MSQQNLEVDVLCLGSGTAGQVPAYRAAKAGLRAAVVDTRPPGGTCANRGCDAKKPFVFAAAAMDAMDRMTDAGVDPVPRQAADWSRLMAFKHTFTDDIPERTRNDLAKAGVTFLAGRPRFLDVARVEVALDSGEALTVVAKHTVIATGLRPRELDWAGAELAIDSDAFLELETLPERLVFVGGGYVGMEFAHFAARFGRSCTVLQRGPRPLKGFEPEVVGRLVELSEASGVRIVTEHCVDTIEKTADGLAACCSKSGDRHEADLIVNTAGRVPSVDGMQCEAAGVEVTARGVVVDAFMRCPGNPRVYAAGDIADTGMAALTPSSGYEAKAVAHNILNPDQPKPFEPVPVAAVAFTLPPLGAVGLTEAQAREAGIDIEVKHRDLTFKHYRQQGSGRGLSKVVLERGSGRILGAAYLSPDATELINVVALAVHHGMTAAQVKAALLAYPTGGSHLRYTM